MRRIALNLSTSDAIGWVLNNGAAGMPNFSGDLSGLITRVATTPSPHETLCEHKVGDAYLALLPVRFDAARWRQEFLAQWPSQSSAWISYYPRIAQGPSYSPARAAMKEGQ
jgi:hypothetical protein